MQPQQMKKNKFWREKLDDDKGLQNVSEVIGKMSQRWGAGKMVVLTPREVAALMRRVPTNRLAKINELGAALSKKHKTGFASPIRRGIFAWIAAHAAVETAADGAKQITPFWPTLKNGGEANPKYASGADKLAKHLCAGDHKLVTKRKRLPVADFEKKLFEKAH